MGDRVVGAVRKRVNADGHASGWAAYVGEPDVATYLTDFNTAREACAAVEKHAPVGAWKRRESGYYEGVR